MRERKPKSIRKRGIEEKRESLLQGVKVITKVVKKMMRTSWVPVSLRDSMRICKLKTKSERKLQLLTHNSQY